MPRGRLRSGSQRGPPGGRVGTVHAAIGRAAEERRGEQSTGRGDEAPVASASSLTRFASLCTFVTLVFSCLCVVSAGKEQSKICEKP